MLSKPPIGTYTNREERAQFIARSFKQYLGGCVLDVGCGDALLKPYIEDYTGIDVAGQPDLVVDLEQGQIPYQDQSYEALVCTDVLEHLEAFSKIHMELFRVASRYVIISLPNMYALGWRLKFLRGQVISKEYSLTPSNRHKWLPNLNETRLFMRQNLPKDWRIIWEFGYYPEAWWRNGPFYNYLAALYPNLFATTYWVVFERKI